MMRRGIIVLGSMNMDLVVRVPRMPRAGRDRRWAVLLQNLGRQGSQSGRGRRPAARGAGDLRRGCR